MSRVLTFPKMQQFPILSPVPPEGSSTHFVTLTFLEYLKEIEY